MSYSSASRRDVLGCGAVQGDVYWCNCLSFLDLCDISHHIDCVSLGRKRKNIAFPWSGSVVFLMVPLAMPASVAFSQLIGVGVCGWPISTNFSLMVRPYFTIMKSAPNLVYVSDDSTHFKIVQRVKIAPLSMMGHPSLGTERRNKCPDERIFVLFSDR